MSAQPAEAGTVVTRMGSPWRYDRPRRYPETVTVDLDDLQEAHEKMHPDGSLFIESCCELICRHLRGAA